MIPAFNSHCQVCGAVLPSDELLSGCKYCLLRLGLTCVSEEQSYSEFSSAGDLWPQQSEFTNEFVFPRFGDYVLLSEIARGGMGIVFRARQISLNRLVAVKLILAGQLATSASLERFRIEAQAAGRLHHPGIIRIYEIGEFETQNFFSMELIDGDSLAGCLAEFTVNAAAPSAEVRSQENCIAELMAKVANALDFAHRHGVLHRDIKPSNILIDSEGQPHLTDFGLAKLFDNNNGVGSLSNTILGSPGYVAPEQAIGRGEVTIAADVYGLGATLYELLTGRPPFVGISAMDTMLQAIKDDPVPARQLNPRVHQDLETIAMRCLEKEPQQRYASAAEVADELERFCRHEPIKARPITAREQLWKWCQRNPWPTLLAGTLSLTILVGISSVMWQWSRAEHANERLSESVLRLRWNSFDEMMRNEQAPRALASVASLLREDPTNWQAAMFGRSVLDYRNFPAPAAPEILHSSELKIARISPDGQTIVTASLDGTAQLWDARTSERKLDLLKHDGTINWAEFSPDGSLVATCSDDHSVRFWRVSSGLPDGEKLQLDASVDRISFTDDGRLIVTQTAESVTVFDVETRTPKLGPLKHHGRVVKVRVVTDANDQGILFTAHQAGDQSLLQSWNIESGQQQLRISVGQLTSADITPDGALAANCSGGLVSIWDLRTGMLRRQFNTADSLLRHIAFGQGGTTVAMIGREHWAQVWSTENGLPVTPRLSHYYLLNGLKFLDDGTRILTWADDSLAQIWDIRSGERVAEPMHHANRVRFAEAGNLDGREVFLTTLSHGKTQRHSQRPGAAQLWVIYPKMEPQDRSIIFEPQGYDGIAISPNGQWIALGRYNEVWLKETATGRLVCGPLQIDGGPWGILFNKPGDKLAVSSSHGEVSIWSLPSGKQVGTSVRIKTTFQPTESASNGVYFATGSVDGFIRLWSLATGQLVREMRHGSEINSIAFSPDCRLVASAGENNIACIWNTQTGTIEMTLAGHENEVMRVAFSADGQRIVTASLDSTARVWNATTGECLCLLPHRGEVIDADISPDSRWIATASRDRTATIWNAETGKPHGSSLFHEQAVRNVKFSPDSKRLLTRDFQGLRLWDVEHGIPLTVHLPFISNGGTGFQSTSGTPQFTPDGASVFVATDSPKACLWNLPVPLTVVPRWFPEFLEAVAGQRFVAGQDMIESVPPIEFLRQKEVVESSTATDFYTSWAKQWLSKKRQ